MDIKGYGSIKHPINDIQAVPYYTLIMLMEINDKLGKLLEESETAPLVLSTDVKESLVLTDKTIKELKGLADAQGVFYAKSINKSNLIKLLEESYGE